MFLSFIAATLVSVCPPVLKSAEPGVIWNPMDNGAEEAAQAGCVAHGFDCVLEIHKFDNERIGYHCGKKEN